MKPTLRRSPSRALALWALLLPAAVPLAAGDWPQYRGPERQGTADEADLLAAWPEGRPAVVWRRPLGGGYSAVAAVGERLYTMDTDGAEEAVVCLSAADGEVAWRVAVGEFVEAELGDGGPRSTPTVAGGAVYAVSSQARLVALAAADGRLLWQQDLTRWGPVPRFGYATSPLVEGELVIVEVGGPGGGPGVAAFDRATGALRWTALEGPAGYSSPIAVAIGGTRQLVFSRAREVVALSLAGEVLWRHPTPQRGAVPMPLFLPPDRIFVASAEDSFGGRMLRVGRREDGAFHAEEVWHERLMRNHFNSSVAVGGHLYGFDNGTLRCLDAATGEIRWAARGFGKGSLVAAGERLFILGDDGTLALAAADPQAYREIGRVQATRGGRAWTAPSLAGGRLYVRDFDEIVSLGVKGEGGGRVTGAGAPASAGASGAGEGTL